MAQLVKWLNAYEHEDLSLFLQQPGKMSGTTNPQFLHW